MTSVKELNGNHIKDCPCFSCDPIKQFKPGQVLIPNNSDASVINWGPIRIEAVDIGYNRLIYTYLGGFPKDLGGDGRCADNYLRGSTTIVAESAEFRTSTKLDAWGVEAVVIAYEKPKT